MTVSETVVASTKSLTPFVGRECAFIYNEKVRAGKIDNVTDDLFVVEVNDAESQFKSFRFDRVQDNHQVHIL